MLIPICYNINGSVMLDWKWNKKYIIIGALLFFCLVSLMTCFFYFYQSETKTEEIYKSALEDFNNGKYQNAYYLFSKISIFSNLKPISIYHRAECAKMLNDSKSEIKQYEILFNNYPKHKLSLKAKYNTAQKIVNEKPDVAKKYFEQIVKYAPNTDYAIASEYYIGLILKNKYKGKTIPKSVKDNIQNSFRHYLKKAPAGRLALNAATEWLDFTQDISTDDYLLIAKTCYIFGEYAKAKDVLAKTDSTYSWAIDAQNSFALNNYQKLKSDVEIGLAKNANYVDDDDIIKAIDNYLAAKGSLDKLLAIASGKGKDYLLNLNCQKLSAKEQEACYTKLYLDYPDGRFSADAMANIFLIKLRQGDIENAIKIGKDHLNKFPNTNSAPMVTFWLGKIFEKLNNYNEYTTYYKTTIEKYPDSYYAYRAYLHLKRSMDSIIHVSISSQPVEYPYPFTKNNIIIKLVNLGDYNIINEFAGDDGFIKSWVLYKKGDWSNAVITARNAMDKLSEKPDKYDYRWRLVYPILYYDYIKKYSDLTGNNLALMLALVREESHFDSLAQSQVKAAGLMQLMPSTANEINSKYSLGLNVSEALFNPEENIRLGNYYYEFLLKNLEGYNVTAVAAYNGGIGVLKNWRNNLKYNDTDEFIEQIPYPETKNYVKKVFRSYWNYVRLYSGD